MNETTVPLHFLPVLYLRRYVLQISVGFSGTCLFRTRFRYCAASVVLQPWPASSSVFRFMVLNRAGFTCDIYETHSTETTRCLVSWAYISWYTLGRVWELTHTHTQMFWRGKKAQPDLQTSRLLLECGPSVFARRPLGVTVNPFMWCGGLNQTPKRWHDMRSCWTTALQAPPLSGI